MKKTTLSIKTIFSFAFFCATLCTFSQENENFERQTYIPSEPGCIYVPGEFKGLISNPVSQDLRDRMNRGETNCAAILVSYTGFTPEAQTAFQYAVDIWAASLETPQLVRVGATFAPLSGNTLGQAGPGGYVTLNPATTPGAVANTFYPVALAEKLSNQNFNSVQFDINAEFNSDTNWYYGLDANPPANQIDFVSVVLHELGHGLGFLGFGNVNVFNGTVRLEPTSGPPAIPSIYDTFIENGSDISILTFEDPSPELKTELTSQNLFSNSPIAISLNNNITPQIWAPSLFNGGSSYSHWDEIVFDPSNINSLMTPSIGPGQANHNPGPITLGFFEDMGWSICGGSLSVEEFDVTSVNVSPNPFTNSIAIELNNGLSDDYSIDIIDINGRVILNTSQTARNGKIEIKNLSNLKNALYFVQISNENSGASITKKVIKN